MSQTIFDGTQLPNFAHYRRPNLVYSSGTVVATETGLNGTSGAATILFPDGNLRTDSATGHIQMTISQNAVFNNATESSNKGGLDTGSVSANHWYAVYAVKVTTFANDWVLVGSLNAPIQANYSTLNTNFGTNSWVYLGMIRYGDQSTGTTSIIAFIQCGNHTSFYNTLATATSSTIGNVSGILMATGSSANTQTWTYSTGNSGVAIPVNFSLGDWIYCYESGTQVNITAGPSGYNEVYESNVYRSLNLVTNRPIFASLTITTNTSPGSYPLDIVLAGWTDAALGIGSNPLI